jgi:hypothetical protein
MNVAFLNEDTMKNLKTLKCRLHGLRETGYKCISYMLPNLILMMKDSVPHAQAQGCFQRGIKTLNYKNEVCICIQKKHPSINDVALLWSYIRSKH